MTCVAQYECIAQWKQLTAILLYDTYIKNGFMAADSRTRNMDRTIEDLDPLLQSLTGPSCCNGERMESLKGIVRDAAVLAFILFSRPSLWQFNWLLESLHGPKGTVATFPTLLRTTDSEGKSIDPPEVFRQGKSLKISV